jgi:hypothetical protein
LFRVSRSHLVEGDGPKAGVVDVRREREGAVGRPDRARDEAAAAVLFFRAPSGLAGEPRALPVQFVDDGLQPVIGLGDGGAGEGVGLDDVGAGAEVGEVDVPDGVGLRQDQEVVVPAQVLVVGAEALAAKILLASLSA